MSAQQPPIILRCQRRGIPRLVSDSPPDLCAGFPRRLSHPAVMLLLSYSVLTQPQSGDIACPSRLQVTQRLLSARLRRVVILTLRVAFFTSLFTFMLATPLAMVLPMGGPFSAA